MAKKIQGATMVNALKLLNNCLSNDKSLYYRGHAYLYRDGIEGHTTGSTLCATNGHVAAILELDDKTAQNLGCCNLITDYVKIDTKDMTVSQSQKISEKRDTPTTGQFPNIGRIIPDMEGRQALPSLTGLYSAVAIPQWIAKTGICVNLDYLFIALDDGAWTGDKEDPKNHPVRVDYTIGDNKLIFIIMPMRLD